MFVSVGNISIVVEYHVRVICKAGILFAYVLSKNRNSPFALKHHTTIIVPVNSDETSDIAAFLDLRE